uniref:Uncharacterized protein n=1 Tax=Anopheles coluzzii TaxID=1518534 RepID=A0A8W7PHJ4_ANOCL
MDNKLTYYLRTKTELSDRSSAAGEWRIIEPSAASGRIGQVNLTEHQPFQPARECLRGKKKVEAGALLSLLFGALIGTFRAVMCELTTISSQVHLITGRLNRFCNEQRKTSAAEKAE